MKMRLVFEDGTATLVITPEGEWEQKMLGAVANGGEILQADVDYEAKDHFSYGKTKAVRVTLTAPVAAENGA